jgi:hypothetical protein
MVPVETLQSMLELPSRGSNAQHSVPLVSSGTWKQRHTPSGTTNENDRQRMISKNDQQK